MDHGYAYNKQPGPQAIIDLGQYFRITDYQNLRNKRDENNAARAAEVSPERPRSTYLKAS